MAAIPNPNAYSDALYRVTYAWGLTFLPHALKIAFLGSNGYQWDNRLGRSNINKIDNIKADPAALSRIKRADAAHQNGNESLLLFAPAVVAAIAAGVDKADVDRYSKLYVILRLVYNLVFIFNEKNNILATVRTGVWGGSVYCSITLLLRAARLLAAKGL